jgi:hypothetical protein
MEPANPHSSANTEKINMAVLPFGLACVASATQKAGHEVAIADLMAERDTQSVLKDAIEGFRPQVIGVSVRNIDDQRMENPRFLLNPVKDIVTVCKDLSEVPLILGGAGYSIYPEAVLSFLGADMGIQGEYKPADRFSIYGSVSFNRMLPIAEISEGINYFTFLAGPRVYITKSIFAGVGAGYALFVEDGFSYGAFAFNPHIGYDRPKTQWTINYTGISDGYVIGNLSLGVAFKLGKNKKEAR